MSGYEQGQVSSLGGGVPGARHGTGFANTLSGNEVAMQRRILRKAFKTSKVYYNNNGTKTLVGPAVSGPFRASFNQGDVLGRKYQSCGGCNQVNDVNSRVLRPKMIDSVSQASCNIVTNGVTPLQVPLGSGNSKYVCDSSLFTRFKHLSAVNLTYNDKSFGGDDHNGSYTFLRAVRSR
jgi:hypothetical protein